MIAHSHKARPSRTTLLPVYMYNALLFEIASKLARESLFPRGPHGYCPRRTGNLRAGTRADRGHQLPHPGLP